MDILMITAKQGQVIPWQIQGVQSFAGTLVSEMDSLLIRSTFAFDILYWI